MKQKLVIAAASWLALCAVNAGPVFAGQRSHVAGSSAGLVTACSRYGNGCYSARLLSISTGKQLLLHHGTRIDCERDCEGTLQESTVDFWDTMRENGG